MCTCNPVVRSVLVRGSCADWFPVVMDSLAAHGFSAIVADLPSLRLSAAFSGGVVNVSLSPSSGGQEALISVSAESNLSGGVVPC